MKNYKLLSNDYLSSIDVCVYGFLPNIKFKNAKVRTKDAIAARLLMLCLITETAFNRMSFKQAITFISKYNLASYLTKNETNFLQSDDETWKINETWKIECMCILFWYLNIIDDLPLPTVQFDIKSVSYYPIDSLNADPLHFLKKDFNVRSNDDLFFHTDLYARLDYSCDMAKLNNLPIAANSAVVYERRYALNWLTNLSEDGWDEVKCNSIY